MNKLNNFYALRSKLVSSTFQAIPIGLTSPKDKLGKFEEDKLISGEYKSISFPVIFRQKGGNKLVDILDTGWPNLYLISSKMKNVLDNDQLTGWKIFEISLWDKENKQVPNYFGLSVIGRCGSIDYTKSEIIEKRIVPEGPLCKFYKGLNAGLDTWDYSDFFLPEKSSGIIVSSKAADALIKSKLTNVVLENLMEIEILTRNV